jgi:putative peptide zinc metalloprotease protein
VDGLVTTLALPALRQDLALHAGPDAPDGTPTWTLHDPAANRYFALSWPAFEMLSRWALGNAQSLVAAMHRETTLRVGNDDVSSLLQMLAGNHLLVARDPQDTQRLAAQAHAQQLSAWRWLLRHYLFLRVPLVRPMHWLQRMSPWVRWAYTPAFWLSIALLAGTGLLLAARRWDEFAHTFTSWTSWDGLLAVALALSAAKVLHELGHAFTATRFGCRVPTMGIAFLVMWPVLYTDTNEAWKLTSRRQRLAIGAAGMLAELALAAVALMAWHLLPDTPAFGPLRSGLFLLATTTWIMTLAINASPFMRFDGYFLLSDAVGLPNLHERSFAIARWWLRERLFGWGDAPPEAFSPRHQRWLITFAITTWLYRLVLFLGIALLVYHAFFKALGLVLMAVELGWFIARPVLREFSAWWQRRQQWHWNRRSRVTAGAILGVLVLLVWPWQADTRVPGLLGARQAQALYAPYAAQVHAALPRPGESVRAGQVLAQLRSPELVSRLALAKAREQQLQWQLSQQPFDERLMEAGPALRKRVDAAAAEVAGLQDEMRRLAVIAPFDGIVAEVSEDVHAGSWIPAGERLMRVIGPHEVKVDAFVDEAGLEGLVQGQAAVFVPTMAQEPTLHCQVVGIDAVQLTSLDAPGVGSPEGGDVPAQRASDGRLLPLQPIFRVRLERCDREAAPRIEMLGTVHLQGRPRSLAGSALDRLAQLWQREASL